MTVEEAISAIIRQNQAEALIDMVSGSNEQSLFNIVSKILWNRSGDGERSVRKRLRHADEICTVEGGTGAMINTWPFGSHEVTHPKRIVICERETRLSDALHQVEIGAECMRANLAPVNCSEQEYEESLEELLEGGEDDLIKVSRFGIGKGKFLSPPRSIVLLTDKWDDEFFVQNYEKLFWKYALRDDIWFYFFLVTGYGVSQIPFLPANRKKIRENTAEEDDIPQHIVRIMEYFSPDIYCSTREEKCAFFLKKRTYYIDGDMEQKPIPRRAERILTLVLEELGALIRDERMERHYGEQIPKERISTIWNDTLHFWWFRDEEDAAEAMADDPAVAIRQELGRKLEEVCALCHEVRRQK